MRVNETFLSLQGEGYFTGMAAFFLRFSGCNLDCPFCDTQHASFTEMSEEEILSEASSHEPRHIVVTGGEPALQLTQSLVDKLHAAGFFIQVETNGTLPLPEGIDWVTVSPKGPLASSTSNNPLASSPSKNPLASSPSCRWDLQIDELKLLFTGEGPDPESVASRLPGEGERVMLFLQPLDTGDEMRNRLILRDTIAYVLQHPRWSLSLQTHKLLGIK